MDAAGISDGPELISSGNYALYRTPAGGMHLSFRQGGEDEDRHIPLPPALVRMAEAAANGAGPAARMKALLGMSKDPEALAALDDSPGL